MQFCCRRISYEASEIAIINDWDEDSTISWMRFIGPTTTTTTNALFIPAGEAVVFQLDNPDLEFFIEYEVDGELYESSCESNFSPCVRDDLPSCSFSPVI